MTQTEFETRTGCKVASVEFERIHEAYMLTDMDKDVFCEFWKNLPDYERDCMIMAGIKKSKMEREISQWKKDFNEAVKNAEIEKIHLAEFLVDEAQEYGSTKARRKAIEILGFKMYIAYKIAKKYPMWEIDNMEIIDHLTD